VAKQKFDVRLDVWDGPFGSPFESIVEIPETLYPY